MHRPYLGMLFYFLWKMNLEHRRQTLHKNKQISHIQFAKFANLTSLKESPCNINWISIWIELLKRHFTVIDLLLRYEILKSSGTPVKRTDNSINNVLPNFRFAHLPLGKPEIHELKFKTHGLESQCEQNLPKENR